MPAHLVCPTCGRSLTVSDWSDGAGVPNASSGPMTLKTLKAGGAVLTNTGPTAGSAIIASDLQLTGALSAAAANGPVVTRGGLAACASERTAGRQK